MKEIQQVAKGVTIGIQNCTDLRYAGDTVFISDQVVNNNNNNNNRISIAPYGRNFRGAEIKLN